MSGILRGMNNGMARHSFETVQKARRMRNNGIGYGTIGKALNVNKRTVVQWCNFVTREAA